MNAPQPELTDKPCPRCLALYDAGKIPGEMVRPLPEGARAPLAIDGSGKCCYDCGSADTLIKFKVVPYARPGDKDFPSSFGMARIAVGNDRADQLRMPGISMGLVMMGYVRKSAPGDLERHFAWMREQQIEPGMKLIAEYTWESAEIKKLFPNAGPDWDAYIAGPMGESLRKRKISTDNVMIKPDYSTRWLRLTIFDLDDEHERASFAYKPVHHPHDTREYNKLVRHYEWVPVSLP